MKSYSCQICGRQLTDSESIAKGVGPECAAKRSTFYTTCGTSEAEIATLEAAGEQSARWIRNFRQDMRAGRVRQAKQCLGIARGKAAEVVAPVAPKVTPAPTVAPVMAAAAVVADEPTPAIVVRKSDRGFRVHPPFRHVQFVAAFKRTIGSAWYPEAQEWFIPASCLRWAVELLEYWFSMPVYVEGAQ